MLKDIVASESITSTENNTCGGCGATIKDR